MFTIVAMAWGARASPIVTTYEFAPDTTVTWTDGNTDIITGVFTEVGFSGVAGTLFTLTGAGREAGVYVDDGGIGPLGQDGPKQQHALRVFPAVDGYWILINFATPLDGNAADLSNIAFVNVFNFVDQSFQVHGGVIPIVPEPAALALFSVGIIGVFAASWRGGKMHLLWRRNPRTLSGPTLP
jgi:hypothetical protein